MHNKFIVIDEDTIMTGSYNFTTNAEENNRENLIIIPNKIVAQKYYKQFNIYWDNP
jgi:phosphatidylserine/phosphatidylglycerophosphate/cardiolipin synthase-like enzyme